MKITFFPEEPSARVKYSMAWVNNLLNKTPRSPTQENPLRLRGRDAVQLQYLWTALMVWGNNHPTMLFGFNEIRVLCSNEIFNPENEYQIGWLWSSFTQNSLYETEFKHYLTSDMLIPVDYPQAFEDVPVSLYKTIEEQEQFKIEEAKNPEEARQKKEARIKEEVLKLEESGSKENAKKLEKLSEEDALKQEEVLKQEKSKQPKNKKSIFVKKTSGLPSLEQLRTLVFCEAIERYLSWRNNKNEADKRGYNITSFTWLRHYTAFGEHRAKQLMQKLLASPEDCLNILKKHFSDYFSINNHSLDTYLLEAIWETNVLFSINVELPNLRTITARKQLLDAILTTDMLSAPENQDALVPCIVTYLFSELHIAHKDAIPDYLALCHQYQRREDADNELCFDAFALIAEEGIKEALPVLERMASEGNTEQQTRLSRIYREIFNNEFKATYWEERTGNIKELGFM